MTQNPNRAWGGFGLPIWGETVLQPESNKAFVLPILQCTTAREVILGLSPSLPNQVPLMNASLETQIRGGNYTQRSN